MTTSPVMTVTDELLAELERRQACQPSGAFPVFSSSIAALTAELRRLRAENKDIVALLLEAERTIHKLQAEQPTPLRIARYLDAMRAKINSTIARARG